MNENPHIRDIMGKELLFKLILLLLIYSLVPLAEIFLFIYLGELIGNYLVLTLAAVAGLAGALIAGSQTRKTVERLREKIRRGKYPGREFVDLSGIIVGGILLITPGFMTDVCGYLLMIPALRNRLGGFIARTLKRNFKEFYEYLRLSSL
jgi:UPF0716 protein FxsA